MIGLYANMEHTIWTITDNVTDMTQNPNNSVSLETTAELPTTFTIPTAKRSLSFQILVAIGLIVSLLGCLANTVVLAVLILARRQYGSSVNTLIINQCAMDLFSACLTTLTICIALVTRNFVYRSNRIVHSVLCIVTTGTFSSVGLSSEKLGLVIITLQTKD